MFHNIRRPHLTSSGQTGHWHWYLFLFLPRLENGIMVCMYVLLERPRSDLFYLHKSISYGVHTYIHDEASEQLARGLEEGRGRGISA